MLAEGIHSAIDAANGFLLLFGIHQSKRKPNEQHPFGYGKELYFWGVIMALLLFSGAGGISIYEGITHIQTPEEIGTPTPNYIALGISLLLEVISWIFAARELSEERQKSESFWRSIRSSKDPSIFIILGEDTAGILGNLIVFISLFLGYQFHIPVMDGIASVLIGIVLFLIAVFLALETRSLVIGESADSDLIKQVCDLVAGDPTVQAVRRPLTMHLGPDEILLNMEIEFRPHLTAPEIVAAIDRIEGTIRQKYETIKRVYIEADGLKARETRLEPNAAPTKEEDISSEPE